MFVLYLNYDDGEGRNIGISIIDLYFNDPYICN
jgi:hypothetical protein